MATVIDTVTPGLQSMVQKLRKRASVNKVMARAGANLVRDHFIENGAKSKNKFGKPPMFWRKMRSAIREESDARNGIIVMERPVAQRYFGGTIRPTGGRKYLTIPLVAAAYRRSARSFKDLRFVKFPSGKAFLYRSKGKKGNRVREYLYALKKTVTQKGDKSVLPPIEKIKEAAAQGVKEYLEDLGK